MDELRLIIYFLLTSFVAGLVGTAGMTFFMHAITLSGITNANMIKAIGSLLTRSEQSAQLVGTILHVVSGVGFAMAYIIVFNFLGIHGTVALTAVGASFGFAHGFVLSFILIATVAEHHPMPEFKEAGVAVAIAHLAGHVIYGALVGLVTGLTAFSLV